MLALKNVVRRVGGETHIYETSIELQPRGFNTLLGTTLAGKTTLREQVAELTHILDEDGYLASWEEVGEGEFLIVEHNCAIWAVASRYGQACASELAFIQTVLPEATVERTQHMIEGARRCAYRVLATP